MSNLKSAPRFLAPVAVALFIAVPACSDESTASGVAEPAEESVEADRTIQFDAVDFTYEDLDLEGIEAGDAIEFDMANAGSQPHEFEVIDPSGEAIGEVEATEAGERGSATLQFEGSGTYTYQCILVDPDSGEPHTALGMEGTFEVG